MCIPLAVYKAIFRFRWSVEKKIQIFCSFMFKNILKYFLFPHVTKHLIDMLKFLDGSIREWEFYNQQSACLKCLKKCFQEKQNAEYSKFLSRYFNYFLKNADELDHFGK